MAEGAGNEKYGAMEEMWPAVARFLQEEGLSPSAADLLADADKQRLSTLCYIEYAGKVLMLRRKKPPFEGRFTAPGGKLLRGEDPREALAREVDEETGLRLHRPRLRLIASETGPDHYNWLLFFFHGEPVVEGVPAPLLQGTRDSDEGQLQWLPANRLAEYPIPNVEKQLLPYIFGDGDDAVYFARVRFDEAHRLDALDIRPLS